MSWAIVITRAGPMVSVQDMPRVGVRRYGLAAAGPVDLCGYREAGGLIGVDEGGGIECGPGGVAFRYDGDDSLAVGFAGGQFGATLNGSAVDWLGKVVLSHADMLEVGPARAGNWGYLRFSRRIEVPTVLGSRSTHVAVGLGGLEGRCLRAGDRLALGGVVAGEAQSVVEPVEAGTEFEVSWGLHAHSVGAAVRHGFAGGEFTVTAQMDRMGVRLGDPGGVFAGLDLRGLVSDAAVPGDIQILGDGTPVVLLCEAQPTGGYPRIATLKSGDVGRFAQLRPGTAVRFRPVAAGNPALSGARR